MADPKDPPPISEDSLAAELKSRLRRAGVREAEPPSMTRIRPAPPPPVGTVLDSTAETPVLTPAQVAPPARAPGAVAAPTPVAQRPAAPPPVVASDAPDRAAHADFANPPAVSEPPAPPLPAAELHAEVALESRRWRAGPLAIVVFFLTIAILLVAVLIYKAFMS